MLKDRKFKRKAAAMFAKVMSRDSKGRAKTIRVPGSEGKWYLVILNRKGHNVYAQCFCDTAVGLVPCDGNSKHNTVCYHTQAALEVAADKGKLSWCEDMETASSVSRLHKGSITITLQSRQGKRGKVYPVYVGNGC